MAASHVDALAATLVDKETGLVYHVTMWVKVYKTLCTCQPIRAAYCVSRKEQVNRMELKRAEDKVEELLGIEPDNLDPELTTPEDDPVELAGRPLETRTPQEASQDKKPAAAAVKGGYLRQMLNDSDRF